MLEQLGWTAHAVPHALENPLIAGAVVVGALVLGFAVPPTRPQRW